MTVQISESMFPGVHEMLLSFTTMTLHSVLVFLLGVVVGILGNLVAAYLWEARLVPLRRRWQNRRATKKAVDYESSQDGMYALNRWSPDRMLTRDNLRVEVREKAPSLELVDSERWHNELERLQQQADMRGRCGYVTDCSKVDWRESPHTQIFRVTVSPADYAEGIATWAVLRADEARRAQIVGMLTSDPLSFPQAAPPMHLAVNLGILNSDGSKFLGLLRSATVASAKNVWTVGPNETMTLPVGGTPGAEPEDFFSLAERCLKEEIGLNPEDYDPVVISWLGYRAADAHPWVTAQVRVRLPDAVVLERRKVCHSYEEASMGVWLPFGRQTVLSIVQGQRCPDGSTIKVPSGPCCGRWIIHAPHGICELWRMRTVLQASLV